MRNSLEDRKYHLLRGGSLKSRLQTRMLQTVATFCTAVFLNLCETAAR